MAGVASARYVSCEVCGDVEYSGRKTEVALDTYCCDGCVSEWEGPRGRTEDGALII